MKIKKLTPSEYPMNLLYLADPDEKMVEKYLTKSEVFGLVDKEELIGVCVLFLKSKNVAEIMNVAIEETHQNKGLGRYLLTSVIREAKKLGIKELNIATGNSSLGQLHLYHSLGFEEVAKIPNYFIEHYSEPIFENGMQCTDQIWLKQVFTDNELEAK